MASLFMVAPLHGLASRAARRVVIASATLAVLTLGAATSRVAIAVEDECAVQDVDYAVVGSLLLRDTKFGVANGVYPFGVGKVRLRFETQSIGGRHAKLMSCDLDSHFTVKASVALWSTKVVTDSHTSVSAACDGAARGTVEHGDVVWSTVAGYRSDGTLTCEGNACGAFGAPPRGPSPLHTPPSTVTFKPFHFSPDGHTFSMDYSRVSHSDSPSQTAYLSLAGRETARSCVPLQPVCR